MEAWRRAAETASQANSGHHGGLDEVAFSWKLSSWLNIRVGFRVLKRGVEELDQGYPHLYEYGESCSSLVAASRLAADENGIR